MQILLGVLIGVACSTFGNLLRPGIKRLWAQAGSLGRRGVESQVEQYTRILQARLDHVDRLGASDRDLYLYLFQWLVAMVASCVAAAACFVAVTTGITDFQEPLLMASLVFSVIAVTCCLVMAWSCRDFTTTSMEKAAAKLRRDIADLTAKLPVSDGSDQAQPVRKDSRPRQQVKPPRKALLALIPAHGKTADVTGDNIGTEEGLTLETFAAEMKAAAEHRQPTTPKR